MFQKLFIAVVFASLSTAAFAQSETVATKEIPYTVKYANGTVERYVAKYHGILSWTHNESGGPSEPLNGHPVDDRQCHWNIHTEIVRDVCLVNHAGEQFCKGEFNHIYGTDFANGGAPFMLNGLRGENCGDAEGRFQSDLNDGRNALRGAIDGTASKDAAVVMGDMKSKLRATDVTPGP